MRYLTNTRPGPITQIPTSGEMCMTARLVCIVPVADVVRCSVRGVVVIPTDAIVTRVNAGTAVNVIKATTTDASEPALDQCVCGAKH